MAEFTTGDRIAVRRHSGATLTGTVLEVGPWQPSCAGTPMRWVHFVKPNGEVSSVADTPHQDNEIRVIGAVAR